MTDRKKNNLTNLKKTDFAFSQQISLRFFFFFSLISRSKMLHENTFTFFYWYRKILGRNCSPTDASGTILFARLRQKTRLLGWRGVCCGSQWKKEKTRITMRLRTGTSTLLTFSKFWRVWRSWSNSSTRNAPKLRVWLLSYVVVKSKLVIDASATCINSYKSLLHTVLLLFWQAMALGTSCVFCLGSTTSTRI